MFIYEIIKYFVIEIGFIIGMVVFLYKIGSFYVKMCMKNKKSMNVDINITHNNSTHHNNNNLKTIPYLSHILLVCRLIQLIYGRILLYLIDIYGIPSSSLINYILIYLIFITITNKIINHFNN